MVHNRTIHKLLVYFHRNKRIIPAVTLLILGLLAIFYSSWKVAKNVGNQKPTINFDNSQAHSKTDSLVENTENLNLKFRPENHFQAFFHSYFQVLKNSIIRDNKFPIGIHAQTKFENIYADISESYLLELESFDKDTLAQLKKIHKTVISKIPKTASISYYEGAGYVTTGGGEDDFLSLLLIKQLRELGSVYPVEVMIPPLFKPNPVLCNEVFPKLGATCIPMVDVFGVESLQQLRYNHLLVETLAVLGSSFNHAFFVAPSTLPLQNPDKLFNSAVFNEFDLITWPSIYRKTVSPSYYEVAGIKVEKTPVRIMNDRFSPIEYYKEFERRQKEEVLFPKQSFHDFKGTASEYSNVNSLYLIDKTKNFDVLLLMLYYTNDGLARYYPLLNLASYKTSGDFLSASAHYFKKTFYQNYKTPDKIGEKVGPISAITLHYDPMEDYNLLASKIYDIDQRRLKTGQNYHYDYFEEFRKPFNVFTSTPMFFHAESPGLNPFKIREKGLYSTLEVSNRRIFGNHIKFYGMDFELAVTKLMHTILCDDKTEFDYFQNEGVERLCKDFLFDRISFLSANSNEYWNKYVYEKRLPIEIPAAERLIIEQKIKSGFDSDFDYIKEEIERPSTIIL